MKTKAAIIALCVLSVGCNSTRITLNDDIRLALKNQHVVDFAVLVPTEWNKMYVFHPYTSSNEVATALGHNWDDFEKSGIYDNDGFYLALFVLDERVVAWARLSQDVAGYGELLRTDGFSRQEARFQLTPRSSMRIR